MMNYGKNYKDYDDFSNEEREIVIRINKCLANGQTKEATTILKEQVDTCIFDYAAGSMGGWVHKAARDNNQELMKFLLENGMDINLINPSERFPYTALAEAVAENHLDMVKYLVENGATFDTTSLMWSPIMIALSNAKKEKDNPIPLEISKFLIDNGIDLTVKYPAPTPDGVIGAYERALNFQLPIAPYIWKKFEESVGQDGYRVTNTPYKPPERDFEKEQKDFEQYQKYQDMVCDVMISRLKEEEFSEPLYALVIEVNLGERYELNLLYNTESACEEGQHKFYPYQFDEVLDLEEEESFFKENDELSQFFGSIIWHEYYPNKEPDQWALETYTGIAKNGLIPVEKLPKDTFELLEITAIHCGKRLQKETDFIPKTEDFQLYVVPDSSMAKKDTFISQTVKKEDLHLFEGAFN